MNPSVSRLRTVQHLASLIVMVLLLSTGVSTDFMAQTRMRHTPGTRLTATPPPTGIPPANVRIISSGPGVQFVNWEVFQPVFDFSLERQDPGSTDWVLVTPQPIQTKSAQDVAFVSAGAVYRLTARYADGTVGVANVTHLNPVPPTHPGRFVAKQVAEGTVELTWDFVLSATGYQLFGPGQPAAGTTVKAQSFRLAGLQPGNYQFRLASIFQPGIWNAPPVVASVDVRRLTAVYRVSINGFHVENESTDDAFDRDGKGDEVFVAANTFLYDSPTAQRPSSFRQLLTPVYGDIRGFPGRLLAGTRSSTGGLRTGDVVPAGNPAYPSGGVPNPNQLPVLVWEGSLTSSQQFLVVAPAVWESDSDPTPYHNWFSRWLSALQKGVGLASDARDAIRAATIDKVSPAVRYVTGSAATTDASDGKDRPIGAVDQGAGNPGPQFVHQALIISQDLAERTLTAAGGSRVVIPVVYQDAPQFGNARYKLFVQIERLP